MKEGIDKLLLVEKWDRYKIKSSPKRWEKKLNELFIGNLKLMIYLVYLSTDKTIPKRFYRLRRFSKTFNEKLISEYSYPPNHYVTTFQRANIPYHPVFYCSDNPLTAIMETIKGEERLKNDILYYMSEWETKDEQDIRICPFIFDNVSDDNPYRRLTEINRIKLFETLKEHTEEEKSSMFQILSFLSNLFLFENSYVVSSYLAHINLYADHNYRPDLFIYPSVQNEKKTVNFAFHPNSVVEKLTLRRVFKMRLTQYNEATKAFTVSISWMGENKNGVISWREVNPDNEGGRKVIEELNELFKAK